jgi:c-di-GMP-binding flagellar brake protein YcgR
MQNDRRQFRRGRVKGRALIYDDQIEPTDLVDVSLGGMRVSGKSSFSSSEPVWVEFTFKQRDNQMVFGKRARAMLTHSEFDQSNQRFVMGFEFLSLTEFQQHVISDAINR